MVICDNCGIYFGKPKTSEYELVNITSIADNKTRYVPIYNAACNLDHEEIAPGIYRGRLKPLQMYFKPDPSTGFFRSAPEFEDRLKFLGLTR